MSNTEPDVSDVVPHFITAVKALLEQAADKKQNSENALQYSQAAATLLATPLGESVSKKALKETRNL